MKAYSMDLRERVVAACESGQSVSSVAEHFGFAPERCGRIWREPRRASWRRVPCLAKHPVCAPTKKPRLLRWCRRRTTGHWVFCSKNGTPAAACFCRAPRYTTTCSVWAGATKKESRRRRALRSSAGGFCSAGGFSGAVGLHGPRAAGIPG